MADPAVRICLVAARAPVSPAAVALDAARQAAEAAGRPLLALCAAGWARGRAWGMLLNTGREAAMARFGQCDVICAEEAAIREVIGLEAGQAEGWLWGLSGEWAVAGTPAVLLPPSLLEERIAALRSLAAARDHRLQPRDVRKIDQAIRRAREVPWSDDPGWLWQAAGPLTDIARWLCHLPGDPEAEAAGAAARALLLQPTDRREAQQDAWCAAQVAALEDLVEAVAREVAGALPEDPAERARLAGIGIARCRRQPPPMSRWGRRSGCGPDGYEGPDGQVVQEPDAPGFDCGMGHVPARAARFLEYYVG